LKTFRHWLLKVVAVVALLSVSALIFKEVSGMQRNPLEVVTQSHNCSKSSCDFNVRIKNTSSSSVVGFVRVNAFSVTSGGSKRGGDLHFVGTHRLGFTVEPNSIKRVASLVKTTGRAGVLNISVGRANESI